MIISPVEGGENHLWLLKRLAGLIEIPQFQAELQMQKDAQSAFNVICKYEEILSAKS